MLWTYRIQCAPGKNNLKWVANAPILGGLRSKVVSCP